MLKPAEDTPLSALALMDLAEKAGLPKGEHSLVGHLQNSLLNMFFIQVLLMW